MTTDMHQRKKCNEKTGKITRQYCKNKKERLQKLNQDSYRGLSEAEKNKTKSVLKKIDARICLKKTNGK